MQTFKTELKKSARIEIYIANNILKFIRKFEGLLQRFTVLVELYSNLGCLPSVLEELIAHKERTIRNINNCRAKLSESRTRYLGIQASLSECEEVIDKNGAKI